MLTCAVLYTLNAICIKNNIKDTVSKAWNFGIRKVFNLNYTENTRNLFYYCDLMSATFNNDCLQLILHTILSKLTKPVLLALLSGYA